MNSKQRKQRKKLMKSLTRVFIDGLTALVEDTVSQNLSQDEFMKQMITLRDELPSLFEEELTK